VNPVGAVVIVAATLAHGLVDNSIFLPDLAVDFWLAIAIANNPRQSVPKAPRLPMAR